MFILYIHNNTHYIYVKSIQSCASLYRFEKSSHATDYYVYVNSILSHAPHVLSVYIFLALGEPS